MCGFYVSNVRSVHHIFIFRTLHSFEFLIIVVLCGVCPFSVRSVHQHPVFRTLHSFEFLIKVVLCGVCPFSVRSAHHIHFFRTSHLFFAQKTSLQLFLQRGESLILLFCTIIFSQSLVNLWSIFSRLQFRSCLRLRQDAP